MASNGRFNTLNHIFTLDTSVTNEQMMDILVKLTTIKILVFAEGGQEAGFTDAYTTLSTQFGDPMSEGYVPPRNKNK